MIRLQVKIKLFLYYPHRYSLFVQMIVFHLYANRFQQARIATNVADTIFSVAT